jgi:hypothetical protein
MPREDFAKTPEATENNYPALPAGQYDVQVTDIKDYYSEKAGNYWSLTLEVLTKGDHYGRKIFDSIFFTPETKSRRKLILKRLGLDVEGETVYDQTDLIGKRCQVTVVVEQRLKHGVEVEGNKVTFAGYDYYVAPEGESIPAPAPAPETKNEDGLEDLPF